MTSPDSRLLTPALREALLAPLSDRLGIDPAVFDDYRFERPSKKYVTITAGDHAVGAEPRFESTGMPFMRTNLRHPKLTTAAALLFGAHATRNVVRASVEEARAYVRREDLVLQERHLVSVTGPGYVIVQWGDLPLGLGLVLNEDDGFRMKSLYPGRWSPSG